MNLLLNSDTCNIIPDHFICKEEPEVASDFRYGLLGNLASELKRMN